MRGECFWARVMLPLLRRAPSQGTSHPPRCTVTQAPVCTRLEGPQLCAVLACHQACQPSLAWLAALSWLVTLTLPHITRAALP